MQLGKRLYSRLHRTLRGLGWKLLWPTAARVPIAFAPGHFYSPIPSRSDIDLFTECDIVGIDLNLSEQLRFRDELDISLISGPRYGQKNLAFGAPDAALYQAMVRRFLPAQVIEVGCGHSTAALFDVGVVGKVTLIEPDTTVVEGLLSHDDLARCDVLKCRLQEVPIGSFLALRENDILFIDSTHVSKLGSDVNRLFFEILPALSPGVLIHIHDIFYPFEYPPKWRKEGRGWNEAYLLRAFLQYNANFRVLLWPSMLDRLGHEDWADSGSIWLQKR